VSGTGGQYSIFTPFKKAVWKDFMAAPVCKKFSDADISYVPHTVTKDIPHTHACDTQKILHTLGTKRTCAITKKYSIGIDELFEIPDLGEWYTTEAAAHTALKYAVGHIVEKYSDTRDSLDIDAKGSIQHPASTSRLSPALAWGLLSARQIRDAIQAEYKTVEFADVRFLDKVIPHNYTGIVQFFSELIWREFYAYLLFHNPKLLDTEFQSRFRGAIHWVPEHIAKERFAAWVQGKTGYSVVDAAMRQLAQTGWMHNRSRMIVASVLTKNLGVDWRWGQAYFKAMLIDIDEASNNGGWQWGASVGADPKPIRIFNPYTQAKNYDPDNVYQKKWLGERDFFFETTPIVEHALAREEALARYGLGSIKGESLRDY
jgi:deoxyribodipyrimidine photolyase